MYLLDTDHLTLLQRDSGSSQLLLTRLRNSRIEFFATIISYEEQSRGWLGHLTKAQNFEQQVVAYQRLQQHAINYCNIPIVPFDQSAAQEYQRLRKAYPRLGTMDLKIAAITLTQNAILLTRNASDFDNIAGLMIEDWSRE